MFRKEINSSKWSGKADNQAFALTLADMDFPLYEPFKQKLVESISKMNNLTYKDRSWQYFNALLSWYKKNHSVELQRQYFVECPSICNLIACCIMAFTDQQQKVLVFTPVYSFYMKSIKSLKRKVVACPLKQVPVDNQQSPSSNLYRYEFDVNEFAMIMDQQKPKLVILCHPHNPSGKMFSQIQLNFIVKKAEEHDSLILSDEIMGDFSLFPCKNKNIQANQKFLSLSSFSYKNIIVANSISKVFNCESVQGGYGIIRDPIVRQKYQTIAKDAFKLLTNQMSLILTPIVYTNEGQRWISNINEVIETNYLLLKQAVRSYQIVRIFELQSSYLTTIEFIFSQKGIHALPNKYLSGILASQKIYLIDISDYFEPHTNRNLFRISIAIHPDEFKKFVTKFKLCLEQLQKYFCTNKLEQNLSEVRKSKL